MCRRRFKAGAQLVGVARKRAEGFADGRVQTGVKRFGVACKYRHRTLRGCFEPLADAFEWLTMREGFADSGVPDAREDCLYGP